MSQRGPDTMAPGDPHWFYKRSKELGQEWRDLLNKPRVIKAKDLPKSEGKAFETRFADPAKLGLSTFTCFFEEFPPGGSSQRHGHPNEAIFYILEGRGYEVHDGQRFEWEAGDLVLVPTGCVHRHVNLDQERPAKAIIFNPKFVYRFLNLTADRLVDRPGENVD